MKTLIEWITAKYYQEITGMRLEEVLPYLREGKWIGRIGEDPFHLCEDGHWIEDINNKSVWFTSRDIIMPDWVVVERDKK